MCFSRRPLPLLAALCGLATLFALPALAGSLHGDATPRPFSQPAPLAQELRHKMEHPMVRELQVRLRHAKYLALYDVDDRFGLKTRETVRKFQKDHGLRATGIVDQATWDKLLPKSHQPTAAELNNTDVGAWFTGPGQAGYIKELQHRLKQIGHYQGAVDGQYQQATQQAIAGFRTQAGLPASTVMDERTWARLIAKTRNPRYAQLFDKPPTSQMTQELDTRCLTGKVVCISWEQKKMSLVQDGRTLFTRAARFARPGWESERGEFRI